MIDFTTFGILASLWIGFIALLIFIKEMKRMWKEQVELNNLLLKMIEVRRKK